MHLEQFLLLVQRNTDARIADLYAPGIFCFAGIYVHASAVGRIFQRVGYDVLQNRVHFVLIQPNVQIAEVAFVSQVDVLYGSV